MTVNARTARTGSPTPGPWYSRPAAEVAAAQRVVPADRKWFARLAAAAVLVNTLIDIDPHYPTVSKDRRTQMLAVKAELEAEAPKGAEPDSVESAMRGGGGRGRSGSGKTSKQKHKKR
jgi:hypothetical protein